MTTRSLSLPSATPLPSHPAPGARGPTARTPRFRRAAAFLILLAGLFVLGLNHGALRSARLQFQPGIGTLEGAPRLQTGSSLHAERAPPDLLVNDPLQAATNSTSSPDDAGSHDQVTDACHGISPVSRLESHDAEARAKYIIWYPRAGMGNVLIGYVSSVMYACLTGRVLKIAPYEQRETQVFNCPEYFDANASGSICRDLEMDEALRVRYQAANVQVKSPEAWDVAHCPRNKQHLEYFLCDDGLSNDEFIAVSSCHYWGDWFFDNPHFKTQLSSTSYRDVLRARISPSTTVQHKMVQDGPYHVCVHVRWEMETTTARLGQGWVDHLGTCVRNLFKRQQESNHAKKEVLLFTMHEDVRQAIKQSMENGTSDRRTVRFASETFPQGSGGHSSDRYQGIADMFSLGTQCVHLLPSLKISTYFLIGANLMDNVSVFPGEEWKDGCLEGSEVTDLNPVSDYWNEGNDVCKLRDTTCRVKVGSNTTDLKPSLRFFDNINNKPQAVDGAQAEGPANQLSSLPSPPATIVTGYFKIPSKHSHAEYDQWMQNMLSLRDPMVIYASPDVVPTVNKRRSHASDRTVVIPMELHEMRMSTQYGIQFWEKQHEMDPEKKTHKHYYLYWIWNEKLEFLRRTIEMNPFQSNFFAWVDIGYFRTEEYNNRVMLQRIPTTLQQDQILGLDVSGISTSLMGGGFIGGYVDGLLRFHSIFYAVLEANKHQFIGKEQDWFEKACAENKGLCSLIIPDRDHGDPWFFMAPYMMGITKSE